ncbi:MAG: DUF4062 domain-containing protein [Nitrospirae bacterium]|nr:DUF4062 domain-containing protein [Nitrospirota bacterium]MBF0534774.1 DUF4062 domain-containing protein [Nitrospirota bacterium]MBF0616448.1 DUF4062 domain-containing protein [Nitrospirota bacterium]
MDKRYQVFVSSTYDDLHDERQEIMQALLELDCIPSGMELFPAANDDQLTLIKKIIDDCDYYIVIIGGRYGSISKDGVSYTEKEYCYALEKRKPIIGFIHKNPGQIPLDRSEKDPAGKEKLEAFIGKLDEEKVIQYWETSKDLALAVSTSLQKLIDNNPATGWVRADKVATEESELEILSLRQKVQELEEKLEAESNRPHGDIESLAQGDDSFIINYTFNEKTRSLTTTWNDIFKKISPSMIKGISRYEVLINLYTMLGKHLGMKDSYLSELELDDNFISQILNQFRLLGLIEVLSDNEEKWALTKKGNSVMSNLLAIKKG